VRVSHDGAPATVHEQSSVVSIVKLAVPPARGTRADFTGRLYAQVPAACVIVNVCPPAVIVADRDGPLFADTL
jgi:hypothetical protein